MVGTKLLLQVCKDHCALHTTFHLAVVQPCRGWFTAPLGCAKALAWTAYCLLCAAIFLAAAVVCCSIKPPLPASLSVCFNGPYSFSVCLCAVLPYFDRCGNIAAILELDEHLNKNFKVRPAQMCYSYGCYCVLSCHMLLTCKSKALHSGGHCAVQSSCPVFLLWAGLNSITACEVAHGSCVRGESGGRAG